MCISKRFSSLRVEAAYRSRPPRLVCASMHLGKASSASRYCFMALLRFSVLSYTFPSCTYTSARMKATFFSVRTVLPPAASAAGSPSSSKHRRNTRATFPGPSPRSRNSHPLSNSALRPRRGQRSRRRSFGGMQRSRAGRGRRRRKGQ